MRSRWSFFALLGALLIGTHACSNLSEMTAAPPAESSPLKSNAISNAPPTSASELER